MIVIDNREPKVLARRATLVGEHPLTPRTNASWNSNPTAPRSTKPPLATPSQHSASQSPQRAPLLRLAVATPQHNQRRTSGDSFDKPSGLTRAHSVSSVHSSASQRSTSSATHTLHSPTSPTVIGFPGGNLTRQQSRAKMAKITRVMGENVPTDLLMSQMVRSPGLSPRPQTSRPPSARRRMSMDVTPVTRTRVDSENLTFSRHASPTTTSSSSQQRPAVNRSRSFWGSKKERDESDRIGTQSVPIHQQPRSKSTPTSKIEPASASTSNIPPIDETFFLTDQQKALNVKRALKMAQVLSEQPRNRISI